MFNKKLKKRIADLEKQATDTNLLLIEQIKENIRLRNELCAKTPTKYKVGDRFDNLLVIRCFKQNLNFKDNLTIGTTDIIEVGMAVILHYARVKNKWYFTKKDTDIFKDFKSKQLYELVDIRNGIKCTKNEGELDILSIQPNFIPLKNE